MISCSAMHAMYHNAERRSCTAGHLNFGIAIVQHSGSQLLELGGQNPRWGG